MRMLSAITALACLMLTAGVLAETAAPTGAWYLTQVEIDEEKLDPALLGAAVVLTLNGDGSFTVEESSDGAPALTQSGTWLPADGGYRLTMADQAVTLLPEDDALVWDMGDGKLFFEREAPRPVELPSTLPAGAEEDFVGQYRLSLVSFGGAALPASALGLSMTVAIEPGTLTMTADESVDTCATTFEGGALCFSDGEGRPMVAETAEYGYLKLTLDAGEDEIWIGYFEPAAN